ncbi:FAD/NAD-P-binding domain-containing protein [Auriscalpium vulgare]|uniref:FAD/NAD-P-binding domain-containing protein n=1 Tax=Auriscalpium vulgare TaxID=40419 RepID=A0ACB8SA28_9AGAM|nr:FAD/NAD-P-binding domain-containing protein [Auriscalpium vulgare]
MPPLKLAVVGGGPSAFYVASRLLSLLPHHQPRGADLKIHIYDRLWAPHGLVRYGVAPDHPEVKNVTHKFDQAAADDRFRFFGNVQVGPQSSHIIPHALSLPLDALSQHYTHILFATGCTIPTLHDVLPPSDRIQSALSLVHWYTQHPSHSNPPPLDTISHVTLIGQGNVSLDVARMLLSGSSALEQYDVPEVVLDVMRRSSVRHVSIVGRRGPHQAAFTTKELREMMNLKDASLLPIDPAVLEPPPDAKLSRQQSRILQLLQKGSVNAPRSTPKSWSLDFFRSPAAFSQLPSGKLRISLAHTALDLHERAISTGETSALETDLVVTALGHHADPAQAFYDPALRHLRTLSGRIINPLGRAVKNVYASGWAAMGARGVLASTLLDAYAVADTIIADHFPGATGATTSIAPTAPPAVSEERLTAENVVLNSIPAAVEQGLEDGRVVGYEQWKAVDAEEVKRGAEKGKERERMGWEEARTFLARPV